MEDGTASSRPWLSREEILEAIGDLQGEAVYEKEEDIPFSVYVEKLQNVSQENLANPIMTLLRQRRLVVLSAPPGGGKTTAAWLVVQHSRPLDGDYCLYFSRPQSVPAKLFKEDSVHRLIAIDDFWGKAELADFSEWKNLWEAISERMLSMGPFLFQVLLVTRSRILKDALEEHAMDLKPLIGDHNIVNLNWDTVEFLKDCYPHLESATVKILKDCYPHSEIVKGLGVDSDCIGLPLCCKLCSIAGVPKDVKTGSFYADLLQCSKTKLTKIMENESVKEAFQKLAVADQPVSLSEFTEDFRENFLQKDQCGCWVQETAGSLSFLNDIVKTLMLTILCQNDANLLSDKCSTKTICQRIVISSRILDITKGNVLCSGNNAAVFCDRLFNEIKKRNFGGVLPSSLLQHDGFRAEVIERLKKEADFESCDTDTGLGYMFWAAATHDFLALTEEQNITKWAFVQTVLGCCYFGNEKTVSHLLKDNDDICKDLLTFKLKDIVEGRAGFYPEYERRKVDWSKVPFHEEDTLLTMAASKGHNDLLECLLNTWDWIPINQKGKDDRTMLMYFCVQGDDRMVKYLLGRSADPELEDKHGNTALHYACMAPCTDTSLRLITKANINKANKQGLTPLMIACQRKNVRNPPLWYEVLLQHGAVISTRDIFGRSVLHHACSNGDDALVEKIAQGTAFFCEELIDRDTPLNYLVSQGNCSNAVEVLIGVQGKQTVGSGDLLLACWCSDRATVHTLLSVCLESGLQTGINARVLLQHAMAQSDPGVVDFIIEKLGSFDINPYQDGLLLHAAEFGTVKYVRHLLDNNLDVNQRDGCGQTPLLKASAFGRVQVVNFLLEKSADINARDNYEQSWAFWAARSDCPSLLEKCEEKGVSIFEGDQAGNTPLHFACLLCKTRAVRFLLSRNPQSVLNVNKAGLTCLHMAACNGSLPLLGMFAGLLPKLEPFFKSSRGITPLMIACQCGREDAVEFLGTKTEDFMQKDGDGQIPLHYAVHSRNKKVINLCLSRYEEGHQIKECRGRTPRDIAVEHEYFEVVFWLPPPSQP